MSVEDRKQIVDEVIASLEERGLILVPASDLDDIKRKKAEQRLLDRTKLTPYQIAKFKLIPGINSVRSVKHMATDGSGRLGKYDHFIDNGGKWWVLSSAVKRLRNE